MPRTLALPLEQTFHPAKIPWATFIFLTAVFFLAHHDWFYSLKGLEGNFGTTTDDFSSVVDKGNLLRRLVFLSLGVVGLASLMAKGQTRFSINGALGWLILFLLAWTFLSLAWSEDPSLTFRRLVLFGMLCLGAFALSRDFSPHQLILWVFFSTAFYLLVGLGAEIILGSFLPWAGDYRFAGTMHPNSQGINCAMLLFASLFLTAAGEQWRKVMVAVALAALVCLFLTKCRTALFFALAAPFLYWALTWPGRRRFVLLLWGVVLICLVLFLADYLFPVAQEAINLGRKDSEAVTLTGRIPLWRDLLVYIYKSPFLGYGYDCFWASGHIGDIATDQLWTVTHAHSAYFAMVLDLGLVGVICYILIIINGIKMALLSQRHSANICYGFMGVMLIFSGLEGILEPVMIMPSYPTLINIVVLATLGFSPRN